MNELAQRNIVGSDSLLPYNATKLERTVEQAIKYNIDPNVLAGFKFKTTGSNINLALSWEYSLAQINIDDFKERVIEGLKFHRLKGTPYAFRMALSWYGFDNIKIEEEEPGKHFAEFQVGLQTIPNDFDSQKIIEIAQFSAPLRSRLSRMYNDWYDVRRYILDQSEWGDFLSDYSGNQLYENSPKFSFGRINNFFAETQQPEIKYYRVRYHFSCVENNDTAKLDWTILDESENHVLNYDMTRHVNRFMSNTDSIFAENENTFAPRKIAKALVALSEDSELDDINSCFSCGYDEIEEEKFELSFSKLSEHPVTRTQILVANREFRSTDYYARNEFEIIAQRGYKTNQTFFVCNSNFSADFMRTRQEYVSGRYEGNNSWHDQQHFCVSWNDQKNYLGNIV